MRNVQQMSLCHDLTNECVSLVFYRGFFLWAYVGRRWTTDGAHLWLLRKVLPRSGSGYYASSRGESPLQSRRNATASDIAMIQVCC